MKINFPNISENSKYDELFAGLHISPKNLVSTEHDPVKSVDIDEGEHYLVCVEHGIRKIGILPADTQILLKRDLDTSTPWIASQKVLEKAEPALQSTAQKLLEDPQCQLDYQLFDLSRTALKLSAQPHSNSQRKYQAVEQFQKNQPTVFEQLPSQQPSVSGEQSPVKTPSPAENEKLPPWFIKGMAGKLLTRKILVIEEPFQLKPTVGELAIYSGMISDEKELPPFAKNTKVLTETSDGSLAMAAEVITDQPYNRYSEVTILKSSTTTDKIITLNTPLKRTLADTAIDVIITKYHDAVAYKKELSRWLPNHPLVAYMEQLVALTTKIPDYKPLKDEANSKTNQQKRAIINYIEKIKQPLINLLMEHYHLRFIEAHTPEEDIQEAIDYYQRTTSNSVLDLVQLDEELLKPHGIETFLDIHAFFKTPLMNMNKRNNFKHKIRTPEEAENFTKLANLSIDLVYEISRFIELEVIRTDS
ncbi:hypothetical protein J7438_06140 [Thalassotalea sp. G20_0]|uniref:hypothetical protein n=1 Tax=Thalassotalea sp. G20_0 TaxID=2821093 RepID=UPI001ADA7AA3|nr:hypothetical protein [Thalassotalea sp. G20_0]MBO9493663.1 hypothetical protein [Thalassotalea sp. G20_0]